LFQAKAQTSKEDPKETGQRFAPLRLYVRNVLFAMLQLLASEHSGVLKVKSKGSCQLTSPNVLTQQIRRVQRRVWTTNTLKNQLA
jgi:hypothetical protein